MSILKVIGAPGSLPFLGLCLLTAWALAHIWPRNQGLCRIALLATVGLYLALALPVVANAISGRLPSVPSPDLTSLPTLDTLFILDGDNRSGRVTKAREVYAATSPRVVWLLGSEIFDQLTANGIPADRIMRDDRARNTREQLAQVRDLLSKASSGPAAIVASRLQTPRVAELVDAGGLRIIPIPSPADSEPAFAGPLVLVPSYAALCVSRDAIYEHAALAYYRWRGWVEPKVQSVVGEGG